MQYRILEVAIPHQTGTTSCHTSQALSETVMIGLRRRMR